MTNIRKAAAELIRSERKARKLKRRTVACRCGAVSLWLKRLETGKHPVPLDDFLDLADAIGFDPVETFRKLAQQRAKKYLQSTAASSRTAAFAAGTITRA
jgi:transcriptional regulator with XRE-family HTH domain